MRLPRRRGGTGEAGGKGSEGGEALLEVVAVLVLLEGDGACGVGRLKLVVVPLEEVLNPLLALRGLTKAASSFLTLTPKSSSPTGLQSSPASAFAIIFSIAMRSSYSPLATLASTDAGGGGAMAKGTDTRVMDGAAGDDDDEVGADDDVDDVDLAPPNPSTPTFLSPRPKLSFGGMARLSADEAPKVAEEEVGGVESLLERD